MAQLASLATLVGAGASVYASVRQGQERQAARKAQEAEITRQSAEREQLLDLQRDAEARARQQRLARTVAAARARLAAGGVTPDEGSGVALTQGMRTDAETAQSEDDAIFGARLAARRRSLLTPDGSLNDFVRAGQTFGATLRNLLD